MNKKLTLVLTLLGILWMVFIGCLINTIYTIIIKEYAIASILAALSSVFIAVIVSLHSYKKEIANQIVLIEHFLHDDHFVGRKEEYDKLLGLLRYSDERIIYISGKYGMGKTHFMKMMCDRINFGNDKSWRRFVAFYCSHSRQQKIEKDICEKICKNSKSSIIDISKTLNYKGKNMHSVLFVDNVQDIQIFEAEEFAKAFIKCNSLNQIVIAIDSSEEDFHVVPAKFGRYEIDELVESFALNVDDFNKDKLLDMSNGFPVYARYIIETYKKNMGILDYNNLDRYLNIIIDKLTEAEKESLSLIICLSVASMEEISQQLLKSINDQVTKHTIKLLDTYSLIELYNDIVYIDRLIGYKCSAFLSKYDNKNYEKIYTFYKNLDGWDSIVLLSALRSDFKLDYVRIISALENVYNQGNFYLLITLGELDTQQTINKEIRESKEGLSRIRFYYLKSLLELGLYDEARTVIDKYDLEYCEININTIKNDFDFEFQYLLVDLEHLTNSFEDAATLAQLLYKKAFTENQRANCRYLYAHCIRHMGEDLDEANNVFSLLAKNKKHVDDKIRLRSIYSAASIKMFQGAEHYDYNKDFESIDDIICRHIENDIWIPYVNRHKAIFEYKINKNITKSKAILLETIQLLEVTSLRIKYDIHFELGEWYRIFGNAQNDYKESLENYKEALRFSKKVNDYNLQSNCQMGIMLLNMKNGFNINREEIQPILEKCKRLSLNINYNSAIFIDNLLTGESISDELKCYWKNMKYSDLLLMANINKSEKYNLKLTVM